MRVTCERARVRSALRAGGALIAACALFAACGGSGAPASVPVTSTDVPPTQTAPGVVVTITGVSGGSGEGGFFRPGDHVHVAFTLRKNDGTPWNLFEMSIGSSLVSGPTFDYQRVIAENDNVVAASAEQAPGEFTYAFDAPIPSAYLPPLNDSPAFGAGDGEMQGEPLLDGTYTVGLSFAWTYTVAGRVFHDVGEATADFLVGGSATLVHRQVVGQQNCDQCHVQLQAHGGLHRNLTLCLCCHTAGAEDANDPSVAGGTPGVTINSRVMFHKIHNGAHLPSVLGVTTNPDGSRDYGNGSTHKPYVLVDSAGVVHDYSDVGFPVWPNRTIPTPKDFGYHLLPAGAQALEDKIRTGITTCRVCHGDPDLFGPIQPPAQGNIITAEPSRAACGACHDDINWAFPYVSNFPGIGMPPQSDDAACRKCHDPGGFSTLSITAGHLHPLLDRSFNPGLDVAITGLAEAGTNNGDGHIDPGERIALTFTVKTDSGANVPANQLVSLRAIVSGPTANSNLVLETDIPPAALGAAQPFSLHVPERLQLELVGHSTAATGDVFTTSRAPILNVSGATPQVFVRTGTSGGASTLSADATALQNFVDLNDATGFARDDFVVIDDGMPGEEEYLRIQFVDGQRLWFSSPETPAYAPGLRVAHGAGATVLAVQLTQQSQGVNYSLATSTGTITELTEFGAGNAVVVSYTSEFEMPSKYPQSANASPGLDETSGKWAGKSIVAGTYRIALTAYRTLDYIASGEHNFYNVVSPPAVRDFQVGPAPVDEPYALVSNGANCYACHQDIWFHDAKYRGFDTCIACHGDAGSEDRPRYVAADAPDTPGVTANFRTMLHKIHMGKKLPDASTFTVVGSGTAPYPDNFTANTFEHILFPAMPGATENCQKCHGATNTAWLQPAPRDHPTEQGSPVLVWRFACVTCHDSAITQAHALQYTTPAGVETCATCHAPGASEAVDVVHTPR